MITNVVVFFLAARAVMIDDQGFRDNAVPNLKVLDIRSYSHDDPREFVTQGHGVRASGYILRGITGGKDRAVQEFVKVGSADSAPFHLNAHLITLGSLVRNIVDAKVFGCVETCCFHFVLLNKNSVRVFFQTAQNSNARGSESQGLQPVVSADDAYFLDKMP